ncbi:MAG: DNA alkylation repair protein [Gemmatimonadetes bacterium]|nr:DNA alkylation repair protein [Gemmatimonadota bacterium]
MTKKEVVGRLKALGTAQNRKVYGRHGVTGPMFGVSYADIGKLAKKIKVDQALAESLWATGNHDARILATYIADPSAMKSGQIDAWAKDLDSYVIAGAFSKLVARTPFAEKKAEKWSRARSEWLGQAGWDLVASLALGDAPKPNAWFEEKLRVIESEVHRRPNRTRYSMNTALIGIGVRNASLEKKAVAAAKRIGAIEVDHGETSCTTPDAVAYIRKTLAHRKTRAQKKGRA